MTDALEQEYLSTLEHIKLNMASMTFDERKRALDIITELNNKRAVNNFYVFVQILSPFILGQDYEDGPHIRLLCSELQDIVNSMEGGKARRKQISLPPRSMKTQLSNCFVAWVFGRHPNWKVLHVSHTQSLIEDVSGRPIRDLIATFEYQQIFPGTVLKKDSRSAKRWETTKGGVYFCAGVDGKVAGRGANILIGDDMMADHAAKSKTEREKICKSYVGMYRSRLWKQGSELMIGTRWHVSDLLGYLQTLDGTTEKPVKGSLRPWEVISIPAILDAKASKLLNLPEGSIYWPGTKELEEYEEIKRSSSPEEWAALYAQTPVIEEGNIFKKSMFKIWQHSEPPHPIDFIMVSLDPAYSEKQSADFSAFTVWGVFKRRETIKFGVNVGREITVNHMILLDAKHGRWSFMDLFNEIEEIRDVYDPDVFVVENKASGIMVIQELVRRGWPVHGYNPTTDKITRAHSVTPILGTGRIHVPKLDFSVELLNECFAFPNYSHDDLMDSMVMAILYLRDTLEVSSDKWTSETEAEDETVYKANKPSTIWGQLTESLKT